MLQAHPPIERPGTGPHDRELCDNARPPEWRNPRPRDPYHLLVIGAGPAGLVAARGAAALGARVALVECHLLGGDCLNYGCVPSKTLIRTSRLYADMRNAANFGARPTTSRSIFRWRWSACGASARASAGSIRQPASRPPASTSFSARRASPVATRSTPTGRACVSERR